VSSSSEELRKAILKAAGPVIETEYADAQKANPSNGIIVTSAGQLSCKKIFFLPWNPSSDLSVLKKSLKDFVNNGIQYAINHSFRSIGFPAVGMTKTINDD
jgi:O-acetyl-ADP-ribose deacetylase (regulator of RNase III)